MEKEELSAGAHIRIGEVTLVPVVQVSVLCQNGRRGVTGFGAKEVIGVVVMSPAGKRALSISGEEVPIEKYASQVPEVAEMLQES